MADAAQALDIPNVVIDTADPSDVDLGEGEIGVPLENGNVIIQFGQSKDDGKDDAFDANLADKLDAVTRGILSQQVLEGIEADIQSRAEWESTRTRGLSLLGLQLKEPRGDVASGATALDGMSQVDHPLLLEATLRFTANAIGELLPAEGPVKIKNVGVETSDMDGLAESFEKDMNHYLTDVATEYYPDTKRMLFFTGFGGCGIKKVYNCPIRRRPVSESIDANDFIVSNNATDLWNAGRITHRISMRPSVMKRMQLLGVYRDVTLGQPSPNPTTVDQKKEDIEGVRPTQNRPEEQPFTLYEAYCELDIDQFAPKKFKGEGLPIPYRITIDKDSREILELRRNWRKDDDACLPRKFFVKYPFVEAIGFYCIGLVHILGNATTALTAAWREMLDAGMFANFPGFIYARQLGKQLTNEFRVPPGGGIGLDTGGLPIQQAAMPLPYHDITAGLLGLVDKITGAVERLGGTADMPVGEGRQDAPVGTTIALLEQATKIESAVHKGLHHAQGEEFQLLKERFSDNPEAFWTQNPHCKTQWTEEKFLEALKNCNLVPVADPNTPSHLHRVAKGTLIKQLQAANPGLYDAKAVDRRILAMAKIDDPDSLFAPPQPQNPMPDPNVITALSKMTDAETKKAKLAIDVQGKAAEMKDKEAQRQADRDIATVKLAQELVIHGSDQERVARQDERTTRQDERAHGLSLQKQGLAATTAASRTALDFHSAMNPPTPPGGAKRGGKVK